MLEKNSLSTCKILIIDDNVNIHQDFIKILNYSQVKKQSILEKNLFGDEIKPSYSLPNFEIHTATQGLEGIDKVGNDFSLGSPFSIVFVDVRMPPGLDGIETIKRIYPIDPNIQIVICSAFSDYSWEQTAENLGLRDNLLILKKPFDSIAVRQLVCSLAKKSELLSRFIAHEHALKIKLKNNSTKLQKTLSLTRATLDSTTDGILILDNKGSIVDFNSHFCEMWGIPKSLVKSNDKKTILEHIIKQLDRPEILLSLINELEYNLEKTSTAVFTFNNNRVIEEFSLPHLHNGEVIGIVLSFRDITEKHRLSEKLEYQATHDALTDLPNRLMLYDRLKQAIAHALRHESKVGVFFLDLDRFKLINDSLSHDAGDELLKAVSQRIKTILRDEDTLARLGGDEFVIVTPSIFKHENLLYIASRLKTIFEQPFEISGRRLRITGSIGISVYPEDGKTSEELLRNADLAMYVSKELGTNQYQFYIEKLNEDAILKLEIETELRSALINNEFLLHYQPQYNSVTNEVVVIEALIRWQHPTKGLLTPIDFLPQAQESGLIISIGEWILKTAFEQNKAWQNIGLVHTRIAINITAEQINHPFFINLVKEIIKTTQLDPKYIEFEITENVILSGSKVLEVIDQLRQLNINIALDNFGAGNSSLRYLRNLTIDRIKIDQSFIKNIDINSKDQIMIQSILNIAKSLDLDVVAEGVETLGQMNFLKNLSCKEFQGYYYSQALTSEQINALLKNQPFP